MSRNSSSKSESGVVGGDSGGSSRGGPKISEGDWLCTDAECANSNFSWRTSCNRCGAEKPSDGGDDGSESGGSGESSSYSKKKKLGQEIGKAMAEKSRGLFSADDWQCNKCGNVNWARRHQCNVCNAPRFGEVEERTGFGGGYNDRGVVEYKERDDSDGEWDEFGRRKKKSRKNETSDSNDGGPSKRRKDDDRRSSSEESEPESSKRKETEDKKQKKYQGNSNGKSSEEEEEEEEEDDDDDGDLSKYDLSGWGDEEEESADKNRQVPKKKTSQPR